MENDDEDYQKFLDRFKKMSDDELLDVLKNEATKPGWTRSRSLFLSSLNEELKYRKIDSKKPLANE